MAILSPSTMKRPLPSSPALYSETDLNASDLTQSQPNSPFLSSHRQAGSDAAFGYVSQEMMPSYSEPIAQSHAKTAAAFRDTLVATQPSPVYTNTSSVGRNRPRVRRKLSAAGDSLRSSSDEYYDDRASISSTASGRTSRSGSLSWKSCTPCSPFTASGSNTTQSSVSSDSPLYYKTPALNINCDFTSNNTNTNSGSDAQPLFSRTPINANPAPLPLSSLPTAARTAITGNAFTQSPESSPQTAKISNHERRCINKKKLSLVVPSSLGPPGSEGVGPMTCASAIKSCPLSPAEHASLSTLGFSATNSPALVPHPGGLFMRRQGSHQEKSAPNSLGSTLRGQMSMRRRTSLPKLNLALAQGKGKGSVPDKGLSTGVPRQMRPQPVDSARLMSRREFDDPAATTASGTQADDFPYQNGPIEIMPGLYLGSEQNAKDPQVLRKFGIQSVLNVAKEVDCPWLNDPVAIIEEDEEEEVIADTEMTQDLPIPDYSIEAAPFSPPPVSLGQARLQQTLLIRPTSSTPNLQAAFANASPVRGSSHPGKRLNGSIGSQAKLSAEQSNTSTFSAFESVNRHFPANARTGRPAVDYIKLPWNHDQSDLCVQFPVIVEHLDRIRSRGGKILVHCQCGVSRSASAVIGYVMARHHIGDVDDSDTQQAKTMGMHDAYSYVKDKSIWVSPNMGLIYQLCEWGRVLQGLPISSEDSGEDAEMTVESTGYGNAAQSPAASQASSGSAGISSSSDRSSVLTTPNGALSAVYVDGMLSPMAEALQIEPTDKVTIPNDLNTCPSPFLIQHI